MFAIVDILLKLEEDARDDSSVLRTVGSSADIDHTEGMDTMRSEISGVILEI
jgi:hypothetical protein